MSSKLVGVVNRTNLKNYGSVLQVYALCTAISKLGFESKVVWQSGNKSRNFDIRPNKIYRSILKLLMYPRLLIDTLNTARYVHNTVIDENKIRKFDEFVKLNFDQEFYSASDLPRIAKTEKYFKFVCGSDQIWSSTTLYPDPMMYLRFAPEEKRIAYAPSIGRNYIPSYNKKVMKKYIKEIPCVSIREDEGKRLVQELTGRDVPFVVDPTLLLNNSDWDKVSIDIPTPENYILCYFLDPPSDRNLKMIMKFIKELDCDLVILGNMGNLDYPSERIHIPIAGPGEFLSLVKKADLVITDSYHGMLFAINYKRNFWSIKREYGKFDQSSRQLTVLSRLGLLNRYVDSQSELRDEDIDYERIESTMNDLIKNSVEFLEISINK